MTALKIPIAEDNQVSSIFTRANLDLYSKIPNRTIDLNDTKRLLAELWLQEYRAEIDKNWNFITFVDQQSLTMFLIKWG